MLIEHGYAPVNGQQLHYATSGSGPLMLFLHGFPEFWYAWQHQLALFGQKFQAVAPDLRGYNVSSKPADVQEYALPHLVEDIAQLIAYFGQRRAILVGHDWGGVVAWAFAQTHPELLEKLAIINAPHPAIFQRELAHNHKQQLASAYILRLRQPDAEAMLSANNYAALADVLLTPGLRAGYLNQADAQAYRAAWSQPGALTGSLNYYRAMQFDPGGVRSTGDERASQLITTPTLVIWGEDDAALLTGNLKGLEEYVPAVQIERVPRASHWIVHEQPDTVNGLLRVFAL